MLSITHGLAYVWAVWCSIVLSVQTVGTIKLFQWHSRPLRSPVSSKLPKNEAPHVTIIRPVKDREDGLYDCLASTFRQDYPREKLTVCLCVSSAEDPAYAVLQQLAADFADFDVRVLVESEDPLLHGRGGHVDNLGPNPKIRNISRAYREARGDIIWIIDCNVWVGRGVAGRMVDKLCGHLPNGKMAKPYKFVHQLPLVVDVSADRLGNHNGDNFGGQLEEMFMATTHAKFYTAINTIGIAPCIVGKSNMFRKSHLDRFTDPAQNPTILRQSDVNRGRGIDFFSSNICEDHLIGDLLWRSPAPGFRNHGLVFGDLAVQPLAGMSLSAYVARRVRWLRVRKWTVLLATLVEPGVESLLCSAYASFIVTTLPWPHEALGIPQTWVAMGAIWAALVTTWMLVDWQVYNKLQDLQSVEVDENTPPFARGFSRAGGARKKPFLRWLHAWIGREALALPIWTWAVLLGTTVTWRGKRFRVRTDMTVVELNDRDRDNGKAERIGSVNGTQHGREKDL